MTERKGKAIFLNGTSSSGKTTIASALQQTLAEPYLHLSVDAFLHQCPEAVLRDDQRLCQELPFLLAGFNSSCAAIVRAGNNIIVDHVLQEPSWLLPCVTLYQGLEVVFIAVRCSLEEVDRREKMRADRRAGMARY